MPDELRPAEPERVPPEQGGPPSTSRSWSVVFGGAVTGFLMWVFAMVVVSMATVDSDTTPEALPWVLGAVVLCAVGLIVWPRTRRLGEGLLLGIAIGLVVAGGVCIPLVVTSS